MLCYLEELSLYKLFNYSTIVCQNNKISKHPHVLHVQKVVSKRKNLAGNCVADISSLWFSYTCYLYEVNIIDSKNICRTF